MIVAELTDRGGSIQSDGERQIAWCRGRSVQDRWMGVRYCEEWCAKGEESTSHGLHSANMEWRDMLASMRGSPSVKRCGRGAHVCALQD